MGWSKLDIVDQAFGKIGMAGYVFTLQSADQEFAMRMLDNLVASLSGQGLRLGYPLPTNATSGDIGQDSGIPDTALEAVIAALAIRLCPTVGKEASRDLRIEAKEAMTTLQALVAEVPSMRLPDTMPSGAGNKTWGGTSRPFVIDDDNPVSAGPDGDLEFSASNGGLPIEEE